jgi:hypothetical protein
MQSKRKFIWSISLLLSLAEKYMWNNCTQCLQMTCHFFCGSCPFCLETFFLQTSVSWRKRKVVQYLSQYTLLKFEVFLIKVINWLLADFLLSSFRYLSLSFLKIRQMTLIFTVIYCFSWEKLITFKNTSKHLTQIWPFFHFLIKIGNTGVFNISCFTET